MAGLMRPLPEHVEALRSAASAIADSVACFGNPSDFALKRARAHVWALYTDEDPRLAQARVCFGETTVQEAVRAGVLDDWLRRLDGVNARFFRDVEQLRLTIPTAARRAA